MLFRSRDGCYNMGTMYRSGFFGRPDFGKAYEFFTEGRGDLHDIRCSFELGEMLRLGETGRGPRVDEAVKMYSEAAASGYYPAQFQLARIYEQAVKDFAVTLEFYRDAAQKGHVDAMIRLGEIYQKGIRVEADPNEALLWYRRGADAGSDEAVIKIASLAAAGCADADTDTDALIGRLQSMIGGSKGAEALYHLGCLHELSERQEQATDAFRRSALQGCLPALCRYACRLMDGLGAESDPVEAFALLQTVRIVASSGAEPARQYSHLMSADLMLDTAENKLTDSADLLTDQQIRRAAELADEKIGRMFGLSENQPASSVSS